MMNPIREFPIRWRLILPLLAAVILALSPQAAGIRAELEGSRIASDWNESRSAASRQISLVNWESWRIELLLQAANNALRAGDTAVAIANLERIGKIYELDANGRLLLGEAYWLHGKSQSAVEAWSPLLEKGIAPGELYRRVIQYWRVAGQLGAAVQTARQWTRAYPANSEAIFTLGLLCLPISWKESGAFFEEAVRMDMNWRSMAQVLTQALQRAGIEAPEEYRLVEIGRALGSLGEWDLALAAFQQALAYNPEYAEAWAFSSEARSQLRQDGGADLERALSLEPDSPIIQALAGLEDRRKGLISQALVRFQVAAKLEPQRALWLVEIGNSYADLHDNQKGLESFQKATQVEPQNPYYWRLLAEYCLANQVELRAVGLPAARQANLLSKNDPASLDTLAQVMLGLDDAATGERVLQQALEKDPNFPAAHLHLGQLYINQQKMDWAQYHLALAARPGGKDAESSLIARRLMSRYFGTN